MSFVALILAVLQSALFVSAVERARTAVDAGDWRTAAAALAEAKQEDTSLFDTNHLNYLLGHARFRLGDFEDAEEEFLRTPELSPLFMMSRYHVIRSRLARRDEAGAGQALDDIPPGTPDELALELSRNAGDALASRLLKDSPLRPARFRLARIRGDRPAMWSMLRERRSDDTALEAAQWLERDAASSEERFLLAQTFYDHRHFDAALPLYRSVEMDPVLGAEASFQIGRSYFWKEEIPEAVSAYRRVIERYPGTSRHREALYQMATSLWRMADFRGAAQAYLEFLETFGTSDLREGAVRNLADVYRASGQPSEALKLLNSALAQPASTSGRQVFLFTKAKVLMSTKRHAEALSILQRLSRSRLRNVAGGTTRDETLYLSALCLERLNRHSEARALWQSLSKQSGYYGIRAAQKLGSVPPPAGSFCRNTADPLRGSALAYLKRASRPLRLAPASGSDTVTELTFLGLYDEALFWAEKAGRRVHRAEKLSYLAYAADRPDRAIAYSGFLRSAESGLKYPTAHRTAICRESQRRQVSPHLLHAVIWQESKYNPRARSGASARGLMQFVPDTAQRIARELGLPELSYDQLYQPDVSIALGAYYLSKLQTMFGGSVEMALAAYNGGPGNADRWKGKWPDEGDDFFVADIGFVETKQYVLEVFRAYSIYQSVR